MGKILSFALDTASRLIDRIPLEKMLIKAPDMSEDRKELLSILEPKPTREETHNEPEPRHIEPRRSKPQVARQSSVSDKETVDYQNREIGKLLLRMERHYAQGLRINGKVCDCLPSDTLIYGANGQVSINNPSAFVRTHQGRICHITHKMSREVNEELRKISVEYSNIPLIITQEHTVYAVWNGWKNNWRNKGGGLLEEDIRWVSAGELTPNSFIAFPRIKETRDMGIITLDLAELLGWYVAEGTKSKGIDHNRIVWSLYKEEHENINRVCELIHSCFGREAIWRDRPTGTQLEFTDAAFADIFGEFGSTALEKRLPDWFILLPFEKQFRFLNGYNHGDGTNKKSRGSSIESNTVSPRLAYDFRLLLFRLGILHGLYKRSQVNGEIEGRKIKGNGFRYEIRTSGEAAKLLGQETGMPFSCFEDCDGRKPRNHGWVNENYVFLPVKSNDPFPFTGTVYNVGVEEDESYLTLNGAVHNCGASKHLIDLEGMAEETIPISDNPDVYNRLIDWVEQVGPLSTVEMVGSGKYDHLYPEFSAQARDLRKEIMGTLDPQALWPNSSASLSDLVRKVGDVRVVKVEKPEDVQILLSAHSEQTPLATEPIVGPPAAPQEIKEGE